MKEKSLEENNSIPKINKFPIINISAKSTKTFEEGKKVVKTQEIKIECENWAEDLSNNIYSVNIALKKHVLKGESEAIKELNIKAENCNESMIGTIFHKQLFGVSTTDEDLIIDSIAAMESANNNLGSEESNYNVQLAQSNVVAEARATDIYTPQTSDDEDSGLYGDIKIEDNNP